MELGPVGLVGGRDVGMKEREGVRAKSLSPNVPLPLDRTVPPELRQLAYELEKVY